MANLPAKDLYLNCEACRNRFLFTYQEQLDRKREGIEGTPSLCPACRILERITRRRDGRIDWYSRRKGYGFIQEEDGTSVFVHASGFRDAKKIRPTTGLHVSYYVKQAEQGPRAIDVCPIEET